MQEIPINMLFSRSSMIPIIDVKYQSTSEQLKPQLIACSLDTLDEAKKFKGVPIDHNNKKDEMEKGFNISVQFSIMFPSDEDLDNFMQHIKKAK